MDNETTGMAAPGMGDSATKVDVTWEELGEIEVRGDPQMNEHGLKTYGFLFSVGVLGLLILLAPIGMMVLAGNYYAPIPYVIGFVFLAKRDGWRVSGISLWAMSVFMFWYSAMHH